MSWPGGSLKPAPPFEPLLSTVHVADAKGLTFECQPGCGFCCTASPLVLPREAGPLGPRVVRADDGTLRIPLSGVACSALQADRRCGVYETRPSVCHLYPYQVHAARRVQVTLTLACPGVAEAHPVDAPDSDGTFVEHPFGVAGHAEEGALRAARLALSLPGAEDRVRQARETFAEYDRRMTEWGVRAAGDQLRAAFLPHVGALARPEALPALFAGIAEGDLVLGGKPANAIARLLETEPEADLVDVVEDAARDAFGENEDALWVEPWRDHRWRVPRPADVDVEALALAWSPEASGVLASYLRRLLHRDQTEGASAWLVDASGYQATPAAAYARVVGEAALQVVLRAGVLAEDAEEIDASIARRGVAAYETSYHSLPTLGSVL